MSTILDDWAPADIDLFVAALAHRDNVRIIKEGSISANFHGLTNAVPAQISYVTDDEALTLQIGGHTIGLAHTGARVMARHDKSELVALALHWLGPLTCPAEPRQLLII